MKKTKKILALALAAVMLVCTTVAATVAYLTSQTEVVNNTFTVGSVTITLDEADVNEYGELLNTNDEVYEDGDTLADRVTDNEYKLIPGHNYVKDPTVHVEEGSEQVWLFVKVENGIEGIEAETTIEDQIADNGWLELEVEGAKVPYVYYYNGIVDAREDAVDKVVFEEFTLLDDADVEDFEDAEITIIAYAVQADGFATAAEAWDAAPTNWN